MARKKKTTTTKSSGKAGRGTARRPVRIALVGCGGMGSHHARQLVQTPEADVVALCDIVKTKMSKLCKGVFAPAGRNPRTYTDFSKMLAAEELDGVLLATPHTLHYPHARDALDAGVHVLSEKPMTTDTGQARDLVRLAARKKRLLGIAFQGPASGEFLYIANLIRHGKLGDLEVIQLRVAQRWKQFTKGTWRQDPKLSGGGQLYDSGAHMLNSMLYLIDSPVRRVFAIADNRGTKVDINATVSVQFENGCLGSVACVGNASIPGEAGIIIYGTGGTIMTSVWGEKLEHFGADGQKVLYPYMPYETVAPSQNFVNAILGNDKLRCPGHYGIRLAELMDAIYASAAGGAPVDLATSRTTAE